jgi:hypothetical protein
MKKYFLSGLMILSIVSCTVQKRRYTPGFNLEWLTPSFQRSVNPNIHIAQIKPVRHAPETATKNNQSEFLDSREYIPENKTTNSIHSNEEKINIQNEKTIDKNAGSLMVEKNSEIGAAQEKNEVKRQKRADLLLYGYSLFTVLTTLGILRWKRSLVMKITRWAKANPKKTRWLITASKLLLMGAGILEGNNLREMGYEFSSSLIYGFAGLMTLGFLAVPFLYKHTDLVMPDRVNRYRLGYLGITLASFMMSVVGGNRLAVSFPRSPVTHIVQNFDHAVFSDDDSKQINVVQSEVKQEKNMALRKAAGAVIAALAVLLIVCLLCTACAGACLVIGAVTGFFLDSAALAFILGLVIFGLSIWGIVALIKEMRHN